MKVYVTQGTAYGDHWVGPVFARKEDAEAFCNAEPEYSFDNEGSDVQDGDDE